MEGEGQKEHQTMKIKHLRVHFFLYTDVKQGTPGSSGQLCCCSTQSRWSFKRLTSSWSSTVISILPDLQFLLASRTRYPKTHVSLVSVFLDMPGEVAEAPEQRTQWSKPWATLLPTACVFELRETALSAECRGTKEITVSSRLLSLFFSRLSSFHLFSPEIMLKNCSVPCLEATPLHCNKGCTAPLLPGFDQAPLWKSRRNFASQWLGLAFHPSTPCASERHCDVSSSGIAQVAVRQVRKSLLTGYSLT